MLGHLNIYKARSHERFLVRFSPFDGCEEVNQSRKKREKIKFITVKNLQAFFVHIEIVSGPQLRMKHQLSSSFDLRA